MAYTAIPTQTDGATLTATYLNTVADDIEFLYGVVQAPNPGFPAIYATLTSESPAYVTLVHRHDNLLYRITAVGATGGGETAASVQLAYSTDGSSYSDLGSAISCTQGTHTGYRDVSGRTLDDMYFVRASWAMNDSTSITIQFIGESTATSF